MEFHGAANEREAALAEALDEVLRRTFGGFSTGWRLRLQEANELGEADEDQIHAGSHLTVGDLRRWSAPLLTEG